MRLTPEQNTALLACGYQLLPATPWQIWHLSQQRRIFALGDQHVVVRRQDGFLETYGTLGMLLEQHAQAQALAMSTEAVPRVPEARAEVVTRSSSPLPEPVKPVIEDVSLGDRSEAVPDAPEQKREFAEPHQPAPKPRPRSKLLREQSEAASSAAIQDSAALNQAKVDLLSEFESKAAALGLSVEGVVGDDVAASRPPAPDRNKCDGAPSQAKYRGPAGQEWSGRGRRPAWIAAHEAAGKNRDDFLIS
ncbi:H-NS histone family protein [Roseomonas elaeocarpi]|uniref:H-NS family nucleoid-associated regulatory protein n=1 Tax=Roseomonas elaeocarpi TaxID=907779 RepID=A0ABV6JLU9_9PROT